MNKQFHLRRADLLSEPEDRQYLPDPAHTVAKHMLARRTPDLEAADEGDIIIYDGIRYRILEVKLSGSTDDGAVEFRLSSKGRII